MLPERELKNNLNDRRSFLKLLAAAPLFATIASRSLASTVATTAGRSSSADVYTRLGVRPLINARGTWTYLSGSLELPGVRQAVEAASQQFVDLFELQRAAGKRLAELSGAESGMGQGSRLHGRDGHRFLAPGRSARLGARHLAAVFAR